MAILSVRWGADLANRFRRAVGLPDDTVLLPDETVTEAMEGAWNVFRRDFAKPTFGSFSTVADQNFYEDVLPANAISIRRVWWPLPADCEDNSNLSLNKLDPFLTTPIAEFGARILKNPSTIAIARRQLEWLNRLNPDGAIITEGSVYLDPVPTAVKTVWFEYLDQPAVGYTALDETKAEPFFMLVEAKIHEALNTGAGAITQVRDLEGDVWINTDAAKNHGEQAKRKMAQYHSALPPPVPTL